VTCGAAPPAPKSTSPRSLCSARLECEGRGLKGECTCCAICLPCIWVVCTPACAIGQGSVTAVDGYHIASHHSLHTFLGICLYLSLDQSQLQDQSTLQRRSKKEVQHGLYKTLTECACPQIGPLHSGRSEIQSTYL